MLSFKWIFKIFNILFAAEEDCDIDLLRREVYIVGGEDDFPDDQPYENQGLRITSTSDLC